MSVLVESSMGELNEDRRGVYPLFEKGTKPKGTNVSEDTDDLKFPNGQPGIVKSTSELAYTQSGKRSKASSSANSENIPASYTQQNHAELLEVDPNNSRRKRQKTASLDGKGHKKEDDPSPTQHPNSLSQPPLRFATNMLDQELASILPVVDMTEGLLDGQVKPDQIDDSAFAAKEVQRKEDNRNVPGVEDAHAIEHKPRKVLKLNPKTGTFGSPPHKPAPSAESKPKKTSGRAKQQKSKLVTIRYNPEVGWKIDQILKSAKSEIFSSKKPVQDTAVPKPTKTSPAKSLKSIHPLFLGKLAPKTSPRISIIKDGGVADLTLTSSSSNSKATNSRLSTTKSNVLFSGFGNTSKLVRFPGAVEPAWPWQGMVHIRGNDFDPLPSHRVSSALTMEEKVKKSKGNATQIPETEDIIEVLAMALRVGEIAKSIQQIDLDEYPIVPSSLRTAIKHNQSGPSIQRRISQELHARPQINASDQVNDISIEDRIQFNGTNNNPLHPALNTRYASIATSLSAFDKGQCENQGWATKYAPQCAAEVLQTGDEAVLLKNWLSALTVNTVIVSGNPSLSVKPAKRKRKTKKLDGFIVSSDEDNFIQNETSENDTDVPPSKDKKTFVKRGLSKETGRPNNSILMSGPHGCGKTAAVYAVAKELGFEVFEINSSSRRSGKDITDRVGDMTRNHLVQHSTIQAPSELDADAKRVDDALADDLKSGRQGTMISFFKSQPVKMKSNPTEVQNEDSVNSKTPSTSRQPPREQKQSLILIEEVDILYKEDSQFWPTVINLIQSSKRPIIMTCNDESLVDTSQLCLHGILRFTPPPVNLAVDYMLMVAACEGHVLKRVNVQSLYETRGLDLRASLTDLNYWCQFGVGSVRGGLDWFYSRFPRGSDIGIDGQIIRVVSEDTYHAGMGCLSQDHLESHIHHLDIEEKILEETWDGWQLDAGEWQANMETAKWTNRQYPNKTHLLALSMYEDFAETMSDADLCSYGTMATDLEVKLDPSTLKPSQKALDSSVLPYGILEASPVVDSSALRQVSLWLRSRARAYLQSDQHTKHELERSTGLDHLSEAGMMQLIRKQATSSHEHICRGDFNFAFDPISNAEKPYVWSNSPPLISVFSGTFGPIVEDVAPYVRSIVAYDARLAQDRIRMSNLLSEGGKPGKRMRKTRAAMSALEGGARKETRRERYFNDLLNPYLVARTGMQGWIDASLVQTMADRQAAATLQNRRGSNESIESERTECSTDNSE